MNNPKRLARYCLCTARCATIFFTVSAQPVLETDKSMPDEWIDKDTKQGVVKLTRSKGNIFSFYFHWWLDLQIPYKKLKDLK